MTTNKALRVVFSVLLIPIGAVFILLNYNGAGGRLLSDIGLALIVAGIVSTFEETVISRLEKGELAEAVSTQVNQQLEDGRLAQDVSDKVYGRLLESPLRNVGIRLVSSVRKGYDGYYLWAVSVEPQTMFFAGRSVLHRVDYDFRQRMLGPLERVIAKRLEDGSKIRIMFLDPRSDLIDRLAREEGQAPEELLSDIATSIGICERAYANLKSANLSTAYLEVRLYNEVPYFAYHSVDDDVIVGFYFSSALGHSSAAYQLVDQQTRTFFEGHFTEIFNRAKDSTLLQISPRRTRAELNMGLKAELESYLCQRLGDERARRHLSGEHLT